MRIMLTFLLIVLGGCVAMKNPATPAPSASLKHAVVFDIDGTLTPTTTAILGVRKDAAAAVKYFADKGYQIIYLSARQIAFQRTIPKWMDANTFPVGLLYVPQTEAEAKDPVTFKAKVLSDFVAQGWSLDYAFGDSTTDFEAYAQAGLARAQVFALQRREASACQVGEWQACLTGWTNFQEVVLK